MSVKPTLHERALQLAATLSTIAAIRLQLMKEGYDWVDLHLAPPQFRLTLKRRIRQARDEAAD